MTLVTIRSFLFVPGDSSKKLLKAADSDADALIADVAARKARDERWTRGYPPDPLTYLNQERWNDELSEPERNGRHDRSQAKNDPAGSYQRISSGVEAAFRDG